VGLLKILPIPPQPKSRYALTARFINLALFDFVIIHFIILASLAEHVESKCLKATD
jgi:hypothetical protein